MNITTTARLRIQNMAQGTIGRYRLVRKIGKGGMAQVYQAHDPVFERDVALKVILDVFSDIPEFREGFRQEAKTIAKLEHRAIVPVYDFGDDGSELYLVMRLMPGESLRDRLNRERKISPAEAGLILNRLAAALDEAHTQGVIHRDIKPANVLLDKDGLSFLSDFGIAHIAEETDVTNGRLGRTEGYVGSPAYMAPEQWLKEQPGTYTDVYQLGVMLYEMLTGEQPYKGSSRLALKEQHLKQAIPSARAINPDLPYECDRVLAAALAKNPLDRFSTPGEMAEAFAKILNPEKIDNRYVLQEELTHGPHAVLYLARDLEQETDVALKKFKAPLLSYPKFQRQFRQLADRLAHLSLPTLLPAQQIGMDRTKPYLAMPFVNGDSLQQRLQDDGRFSIDQVCQLLLPLSRDMDEAAKQGFIHKNIKPGNILLNQEGACFVSDFGALDVVELTETVVHSQEIVGSHPYMAPEQWRCEELDGRTNVYQFGVMVYELLAGTRPFSANSYEGWQEKHLHEPVPDICQLVPDLPPACNDIFRKALAKERDGRYATVTEFITTLEQAHAVHTIESLYNRGLTLYRQGKLEAAIELFEQVIAIDPNYQEVRTYLGWVNEEKRKVKIYESGRNEFDRQRWEEAVYWFTQIPGYQDVDLLLNEANTYWEKDRLYEKGLLQLSQGKTNAAKKAFRKLIRLDPTYKDVQEHLRSLEITPISRKKSRRRLLLATILGIAILGGFLLSSYVKSILNKEIVSISDCLNTANITLAVKSGPYTGTQFRNGETAILNRNELVDLEVKVDSAHPQCKDVRDSLLFTWTPGWNSTLWVDSENEYLAQFELSEKDVIAVSIRTPEGDVTKSLEVIIHSPEE